MDYKEDIRILIDIYLEENNLDYLTKDEKKDLIEYAWENLKDHYEKDVNKTEIEKMLNQLLEIVYIPKGIEETTFEITAEYDKLEAHYDYLMNLPQPEQKSKEWFDMRNNMITASSAAAAMGESKYDTLDHFIYEKVFGKEFSENKFVHHGKKYEEIVTMFFSHVYDVRIGEFGLLKHPEIDFIGASPDGICSAYKLDGTRGTDLLGTMVEIKCPFSREIKTGGEIIDGICPYYYWVQVQLQLQCCSLQRCDFIQCIIKEYDTQEEFMEDDYVANHIENNNEMVAINNTFGRNAVIQLLPINFVQKVRFEKREWYSKYFYPPSLNMTKQEILDWIEKERKDFPNHKWAKDYKFDKACFFRITQSHNCTIMRDDAWFAEAVPKLKVTWDKIKFLRENKEEALKFKATVDARKKNKDDTSSPNPHIIGSGPKLVQTTLQMKPSQNTSGFIDSDEMPSGPSIPIVPTQHASPILMPVKNVSKKDNSGFLDSE
jgi:putative phage-type endonuclease